MSLKNQASAIMESSPVAKFADYNDDGYPDLFIIQEGSDILYKNNGKGTFINVSDDAKVEENSEGTSSLFFDFDHDGDLDLFVTREGLNLLYRNHGPSLSRLEIEPVVITY